MRFHPAFSSQNALLFIVFFPVYGFYFVKHKIPPPSFFLYAFFVREENGGKVQIRKLLSFWFGDDDDDEVDPHFHWFRHEDKHSRQVFYQCSRAKVCPRGSDTEKIVRNRAPTKKTVVFSVYVGSLFSISLFLFVWKTQGLTCLLTFVIPGLSLILPSLDAFTACGWPFSIYHGFSLWAFRRVTIPQLLSQRFCDGIWIHLRIAVVQSKKLVFLLGRICSVFFWGGGITHCGRRFYLSHRGSTQLAVQYWTRKKASPDPETPQNGRRETKKNK